MNNICMAQCYSSTRNGFKHNENDLFTVLDAKKPFIHPGLLQNRQDLELVKKYIKNGEQPWKEVFDKIKEPGMLDANVQAFAHVIRGVGGRAATGGKELSESAQQAYACSMIWYVTGDKRYAQKAIDILDKWSRNVWDFGGNDAKLLAAWTGHVFANAAEILRYSNAGWKQQDIDRFKQMLLTVYYPLLKNYFIEANGNWDAAIINTLLCIGIFCDDHDIFNAAVAHFLLGKGNGGITKYIYPNGQCEESTRDQGHVQLGLGEFAECCQVAWTQGIDLYGVANNRVALGFEYTAKYMAGEEVPVYGLISTDERGRYRNVYEAIYQHYHVVKGLELPYVKRAVEATRPKAGIELLSSVRMVPVAKPKPNAINIATETCNGAIDRATATRPSNASIVLPGESIQAAIDKYQNSNGWIILVRGVHTISEPLRLRSGITLAGEGKESVLFLDPKASADIGYAAIVSGSDSLHDVVLRDFVVEGATTVQTFKDPNHDRRVRSSQITQTRAGILLTARMEGQFRNIELDHITVRHCTHNGVAMAGVQKFKILYCDFSDNGGAVSPGGGLLHNLWLYHVSEGQVLNSRLDDSPWGCGIDLAFGANIMISNNELARNYLHGVSISESNHIIIGDNLVESNDTGGIFSAKLFKGNSDVLIQKNTLQYNGPSVKDINKRGQVVTSRE